MRETFKVVFGSVAPKTPSTRVAVVRSNRSRLSGEDPCTVLADLPRPSEARLFSADKF